MLWGIFTQCECCLKKSFDSRMRKSSFAYVHRGQSDEFDIEARVSPP
jgi:hypothetical protein